MRDFILVISVIAYMIGGYFFVVKAERFFRESFRGFNDDGREIGNKSMAENENEPLNKTEK